ncbi:E2F-associated phosphoprotein-like [Amphiura filiformis]|uniref:E2F-associated phosphoprotein-like n=1 Tax=Amphiura filiformis TaxID=82378 RepID=UPI003B227D10
MEHDTSRVPFLIDFDYIEDESDEERRGQDSSEDELDIILHGTPEQKRKLTRSLSRGSLELSSSDDEFEKDMEKELNETMRLHEQQYRSAKDQASCSGIEGGASGESSTGQQSGKQSLSLAQQFYDDIYFDSDSDSGEEGERRKKQKKDKKQKSKHRVMTNDELLYDPDIDDENQKWVDKQRQKYRNQQATKPPPKKMDANNADTSSKTENGTDANSSSVAVPKQPKSDAILNCPACLTTLCLDCQRHELYHNQYRAMFVLNCTIIRSERLKYPVPKKTKRWNRNRGKRRHGEIGEGSGVGDKGVGEGEDSEELYFPVKCSVCNTEVGVYDEDEVFHFFNVLTSTA